MGVTILTSLFLLCGCCHDHGQVNAARRTFRISEWKGDARAALRTFMQVRGIVLI